MHVSSAFLEAPARVYSGIRYKIELPTGNPFPNGKHELVYTQLIRNGTLTAADISLDYPLVDGALLAAAHSEAYLEKVWRLDFTPAEARKIGLPIGEQLIQRAHASVSASYWATQHALVHGLGINVGGGTHHAFADRAEAYCIFNDAAVCVAGALKRGLIHRPLVIDLDVHQGNGTANIFSNHPAVFTFSMHAEKNYPLTKENSTIDIALSDGTTDAEYLEILHTQLRSIAASHVPDFVFYIAGADVLATDRLGKLGLTPEGAATRDSMVFTAVRAMGCPLVLTLGGGYPGNLNNIVNTHVMSIDLALRGWS